MFGHQWVLGKVHRVSCSSENTFYRVIQSPFFARSFSAVNQKLSQFTLQVLLLSSSTRMANQQSEHRLRNNSISTFSPALHHATGLQPALSLPHTSLQLRPMPLLSAPLPIMRLRSNIERSPCHSHLPDSPACHLPIPPQRATTVARGIKRQRSHSCESTIRPRAAHEGDSPEIVSTRQTRMQPPRPPLDRVKKRSRERLFDALAMGEDYLEIGRVIRNIDDLTYTELKILFHALHECARATEQDVSLAKTRESIDAYIDAIFKDNWESSKQEPLPKPAVEITAPASVVAGRVCGEFPEPKFKYIHTYVFSLLSHLLFICKTANSFRPELSPTVDSDRHYDLTGCIASETCKLEVTATATYTTHPPQVKIEFTTLDPLTQRREAISPLFHDSVNWVSSDWGQNLRAALEATMKTRLHRYNKFLAVWHGRRCVQRWANGEIGSMDDVKATYLGSSHIQKALQGLGSMS